MFYQGHVELLDFEIVGDLRCITDPMNFIGINQFESKHYTKLSELPEGMEIIDTCHHRRFRRSNGYRPDGQIDIILTKQGEHQNVSRKLKLMLESPELENDLKTYCIIDEVPANAIDWYKNLARDRPAMSRRMLNGIRVHYLSSMVTLSDIHDVIEMDECLSAAMQDVAYDQKITLNPTGIPVYTYIYEKPTIYIYGKTDRIEI